LTPGELIGQLGDCHLYNNHLDPAKEYIGRSSRALPQLELDMGIYGTIHSTVHIPEKSEIKLNNYNPYAAIKAELSVGK
jgi:thymidylate synthase